MSYVLNDQSIGEGLLVSDPRTRAASPCEGAVLPQRGGRRPAAGPAARRPEARLREEGAGDQAVSLALT